MHSILKSGKIKTQVVLENLLQTGNTMTTKVKCTCEGLFVVM